MKTLTEINAILENRLATQSGGRGKIVRQSLRNLAKLGHCKLPSGFGVCVQVSASI